jgi:hypothetical protein
MAKILLAKKTLQDFANGTIILKRVFIGAAQLYGNLEDNA